LKVDNFNEKISENINRTILRRKTQPQRQVTASLDDKDSVLQGLRKQAVGEAIFHSTPLILRTAEITTLRMRRDTTTDETMARLRVANSLRKVQMNLLATIAITIPIIEATTIAAAITRVVVAVNHSEEGALASDALGDRDR
jgi:hypothetical protein